MNYDLNSPHRLARLNARGTSEVASQARAQLERDEQRREELERKLRQLRCTAVGRSELASQAQMHAEITERQIRDLTP